MKLFNRLKNFANRNYIFNNLKQITRYIKRKPLENLKLSKKYSEIRQESINLWNEYLISTDEVPFFVGKLSEESISNLNSLFDENYSTERELNVSAIYPGYFTNEQLLIASHLGHSKSIDLVASLEYFRELNDNGWNLLEKITQDIKNDLRKFSNRDVIFFQARLPIVRPYIESKRIQSNIRFSSIEEEIFRKTTAYIDHTDGWPLKMNKIIIYPNGASQEIGTTEIVLPNGKRHTVNCESGGYVNFQNSVSTHKAVPGNSNIERKSIQLSYFFSPLDRPSSNSMIRTPHFSNFPSTPREIDHEVEGYQKDICQKIESNLKIFYEKYKG